MCSGEHGVEHLALLLVGGTIRCQQPWAEQKAHRAALTSESMPATRPRTMDERVCFLVSVVIVLVLDVDAMHGLWIVYVQHPRLHNETEVKLIGY